MTLALKGSQHMMIQIVHLIFNAMMYVRMCCLLNW